MAEFVRIDKCMQDAVLTIMKYIQNATGSEPTQEEIANALKSYFILNEVGNQLKYQLKKKENGGSENQVDIKEPFWKLNLMADPGKNILARAGFFHRSVSEAIEATREFMKKTIGAEPENDIIAGSLKSSFILSEIRNQIDWQRKNAKS